MQEPRQYIKKRQGPCDQWMISGDTLPYKANAVNKWGFQRPFVSAMDGSHTQCSGNLEEGNAEAPIS